MHKFEVSKLTFGNSMHDANIFSGLHNIGCSKIEMFSVDDVLSMSLLYRPRACTEHGVIGKIFVA